MRFSKKQKKVLSDMDSGNTLVVTSAYRTEPEYKMFSGRTSETVDARTVEALVHKKAITFVEVLGKTYDKYVQMEKI